MESHEGEQIMTEVLRFVVPRLRFPVPYLDKILNIYEAAASQARLRKRRDDDLFFPLCMFAGLDPGTLNLCYGSQIKHWPLCLIRHSLYRHKQLSQLSCHYLTVLHFMYIYYIINHNSGKNYFYETRRHQNLT